MNNWVMPNTYTNLYPMVDYNKLNMMGWFPYNNFIYPNISGNFYRGVGNNINKMPIKMRVVTIEEILD